MSDILEYKSLIESGGRLFQMKGWADSPPPSYIYWLKVKIKPNDEFCGETEFFVQKDDILKFIDELSQLFKGKIKHSTIRCCFSGSYITFDNNGFRELNINGRINERWAEEDDYLCFKIPWDKSIIPTLIRLLRELITD
jgi:hypothetical protein